MTGAIVRCLAFLLVFGLFLGCSEEGTAARFVIEVAYSPEPDAGNCAGGREGERARVTRVTLSVCECEGTVSECLDLSAPCAELGTRQRGTDEPADAGIILLNEEGGADFDVRTKGTSGPYRLDALAFEGDVGFAEGHAVVESFAQTVTVRMYPYRRTSCAGLPLDDERYQPESRALHAAVALPNGDVLIFGGVRGASAGSVALQPREEVEVYSATEDRFYRVAARTSDGDSTDFPRVLFGHQLLSACPDGMGGEGRFCVRVVGGFDTGVLIDARQAATFHQAPVRPAPGDAVRDVMLVYNPQNRTVEIANAHPVGFSSAGANVVGEFFPPNAGAPDAPRLAPVLLGIQGDAVDRNTKHQFVANYWFMDAQGGTPFLDEKWTLQAERFGATVTPLSNVALVWGGNINEQSVADVSRLAGEVLDPATPMTPTALGTGGTIPEPTAFHSATPMGDGVLVAGGLKVLCRNDAAPELCNDARVPIRPNYTDNPLVLFQQLGTAPITATVLNTGAYVPSIHHAALPMPGRGTVLLIGGAVAGQLEPSAQVVEVSTTGGDHFVLEGSYVLRLLRARWGVAAAPLPNGRILVTGGLVKNGTDFEAVPDAEVIFFGGRMPIPELMDAGLPDAGPPPMDAGPIDAALDAGDAGDAGDASPMADGG